jgi:putative NIF3 family GTP cyclohydrolase 1 type 2
MGGSGASFIEKAHRKGVELYITGDIKYHDARLAEQLEIEVADIGHFHSELYSTEIIKKLIDKQFDIKIETFKGEKDPFILWR